MGAIFSSSRGVSTTMATKFVNDTITSDKVVIFSKTHCPYCSMAKEQFDKLKQKFTVVELDNRDDCNDIQAALGELTGAKSVPRVFVNGRFVGGGTDVKKLNETGELAKLLAS